MKKIMTKAINLNLVSYISNLIIFHFKKLRNIETGLYELEKIDTQISALLI